VALVSALVALAFQIWPWLRPDPRESLSADITILAVDRNVTLLEYLRQTTFSASEFAARRKEYMNQAQLTPATSSALFAIRGHVIYVASTIEGYKRRSVVLRWSMYQSSGRRLRSESFSGVQASRVRLDAPTDRFVDEIWFPRPPRSGRYFVRVALYDRNNVLLDIADSARFQASSA